MLKSKNENMLSYMMFLEFKENIKQTVGNAVSGALDSIVGMFKGGVENAQ